MRRLTTILLFTAASATAADREFKDVVNALSAEFHVRPMHIPFVFGFVNTVAFFARPAGARHIDVAIFENLDFDSRDIRDAGDLIQGAVGGEWLPFVKVHSRRRGQEETSLIYIRPEGRDCALLVTTVERGEAVVVQLKLNPEALQRWIDKPVQQAWSRRDRKD